jgi:Rhodanese-related sulfurtransferase
MTELKAMDFSCAVPVADAIESISSEALQADLSAYQLLDVREDWERQICQLPGAHLPLPQILAGDADFASVGIDSARPVCVYCKGGVRSLKAAEAMREQYGFTQLKSLEGGILAWAKAVDPSLEIY